MDLTRKSLISFLQSNTVNTEGALRLCLSAARGLEFLHRPIRSNDPVTSTVRKTTRFSKFCVTIYSCYYFSLSLFQSITVSVQTRLQAGVRPPRSQKFEHSHRPPRGMRPLWFWALHFLRLLIFYIQIKIQNNPSRFQLSSSGAGMSHFSLKFSWAGPALGFTTMSVTQNFDTKIHILIINAIIKSFLAAYFFT